MKTLSLYISLLAWTLLCSTAVAQQQGYKGEMEITPVQLEQIGDSLYLSIDFDMQNLTVDPFSSITLIPILIAPQNYRQLPQISIKGRIEDQNFRRELSMMSKEEQQTYAKNMPYAIIKGYKSKDSKKISYRQTLAFEAWMKDARLDVREDMRGCGNAPVSLSARELVDKIPLELVIEPYQIVPHLAYAQPAEEQIKKRETFSESFLSFEVYKTDIRPDYMDNAAELKRLSDKMKQANSGRGVKISKVTFVGYASPEGPLELNTRLAQERATSLANHFLKKFDYLKNICHIEFGGENWKDLIQAVEGSTMQYKEQVLAILLDNTIDDNVREARIKKFLNGEPYHYMLSNYYPPLRKAICLIDYDVKKFDLEEAKEVIKMQPENLSLNEMYMVANSYRQGSAEFYDAIEIAVRTFPNDETAKLNAASAALSRKEIEPARRYLSTINADRQTPQYNNAMGVLLMLEDQYDQAKVYLQSASAMGLDAANQNLEELNKRLKSLTKK